MEAMAAGAVDVMCKPNASASVGVVCEELTRKIRAASRAHIKVQRPKGHHPLPRLALAHPSNTIFAIGASTGGVQALTTVLSAFPQNVPGTLVVQHMPRDFTSSFTARLNRECSVVVREARDGDRVVPGHVLIAPGGYHMILQRRGTHYVVAIQAGPRVYHQRPSVEVLFDSVAAQAGSHAVGAILTGMGQDGARGLLNMRQQGARTVAQDEDTCVVYGMPKEAVKCGAVEKVVPLQHIAETMLNMIRRPVAIGSVNK